MYSNNYELRIMSYELLIVLGLRVNVFTSHEINAKTGKRANSFKLKKL